MVTRAHFSSSREPLMMGEERRKKKTNNTCFYAIVSIALLSPHLFPPPTPHTFMWLPLPRSDLFQPPRPLRSSGANYISASPPCLGRGGSSSQGGRLGFSSLQ